MRIWVTGVGVVSPLAHGARATMDRLVAGDRGFRKLSLFSLPAARAQIAAEVDVPSALGIAAPGREIAWSRTDVMALFAAREALAEAGLDPRADAMALAVGSSTTGMFENELELGEMSRDPALMAPLASVVSHPLSSVADRLREGLGGFEVIRTVCSACSSGANAVLLGAAWLRSGRASRVLAGGADGMCRLTFAGFSALSAMSPEPCRPFDRRRNGLNLGEAAAFLVLETDASARARGATPLAELGGWASFAEAHHITNPEPSGATAARAIRTALARGNVTPKDLDYVNAHGTATPLNDAMEATAIRAALGAEADRVLVSSSKGQIGHTLAAAGAIEAVIATLAVARGEIPPTAGLEEIDPACPLAHVLEGRKAKVRAAISNSFGFGGADTSLLFTEPERFAEPTKSTTATVVLTGGASIGPLGVLSASETTAYLEPGPEASPAPLTIAFAEHLDVGRARRIDRNGRFITILVQRALAEAGLHPGADDAFAVGALVGSAFSSVDASTTFLRKLIDKGAGLVPPADFPNLVPSSPTGHASIYLGLRGLVLASADLGASAESAVAAAAELCATNEAAALVAGSFDETTPLIDLCIGPVTSGPHGRRGEGGAVVVVEGEAHAIARGARIRARLAWWRSWRGDPTSPLADVPPPGLAPIVLSARGGPRVDAALAGSAWAAVPRIELAPRTGDHEGAGGFALAAAMAALDAGRWAQALVIGEAPDRSTALLLTAGGA